MSYTETQKGIANMVWGVIGQVVILVLGIAIPRLVLLNYGSEMNGFLNSMTQGFSYMALLEVGVGGSTLQALYRPVAQKDYGSINSILSATASYYKKTGIIYFGVLVLFALIYPVFVTSSIPALTMSLIILFNGMNLCLGFFIQNKFKLLLQAEGKNYIIINIHTIVTVLVSIVKAVLLLNGYDILLVQFSCGMISCLQSVYYYFYTKRRYRWINYQEKPNFDAISQKNSVMVQQITSLIFNNTDVFLLTIMGQDLKLISLYTVYNLVLYMVKTLINQVLGSFSFKLGQLYQVNKKSYLEYHHIFEIMNFVIIFSAMTVLNYCMIPFVRLYTYGVDDINYVDYKLLLLFIVIQLLDIGRTSSMNAINFAGHFKKTQNRCIIESCMNIGFSIVGIYFFGIYGALLGTISALLYRANDMILYSYKYLLHQNPFITYKRWFVCIVVFVFLICKFSWRIVKAESYLELVGVGLGIGALSICIYGAVLLLVDVNMFRKIGKILLGLLKIRV